LAHKLYFAKEDLKKKKLFFDQLIAFSDLPESGRFFIVLKTSKRMEIFSKEYKG
jgi:hypothetical protein